MRNLCLILALLAVAAMPPLPPKRHKSTEVQRGATKLISKTVVLAPTTNTTSWKYPPGVVASDWFWNVEASSDLAHWSVLISNASGPAEVRVKRTDPPGFYRLSGRSSP